MVSSASSFTLSIGISLTLPLICIAITVTCKPKGEWLDVGLQQCFKCSQEPCHIGYYRESCTSNSRQNARCVPCSPPPFPNARHVSGGLPYTFNGCLWACNEGFYRDIGKTDMCILCNTSPCEDSSLYMREKCPLGSTRDAQCILLPVENNSFPFINVSNTSSFTNFSNSSVEIELGISPE